MNILLLCDKPNWSYHSIAKGLIRYNSNASINFDLFHLKLDYEKIHDVQNNYDLVFPMGWQFISKQLKTLWPRGKKYKRLLPWIESRRIVTGIHSHRAWDDYKTLPHSLAKPPKELIRMLSSFAGVNVVSKRLYKLFHDEGLNNLFLTEPGVDISLFKRIKPYNLDSNKPLVIGFSGTSKSKKHDNLKGVSQFIKPLEQMDGIELKLAIEGEITQKPLEEMHKYYNELDLYISVSNSEGFSQSVLEAFACGCPIISTRVGGNEDLIKEGVNGFFVNRNLEEIKKTITYFIKNREELAKMGNENIKIVQHNYDWNIKVKTWTDFMTSSYDSLKTQ
jgi:glycosyltransferase involved in cell wall biosynthesis